MFIIGHRGAAGLAPENTLKSFEAAMEWYVDMIEFDVRLTFDEVPVLLHDGRLFRTHRITNQISQMTFAELQEATAAQPVPSLEQVLDRYFGKVMLNIELKSRDAGLATLKLLRSRYIKTVDDWHKVMISSFKPSDLKAIRHEESRACLGLLHDDNPYIFIAYARRLNLSAVGFHKLYLSRFAMEIAKRSDLFSYVFTVNRPTSAQALTNQGYDGVVTNYPDVLQNSTRQ